VFAGSAPAAAFVYAAAWMVIALAASHAPRRA
jgi:hypothetical protein